MAFFSCPPELRHATDVWDGEENNGAVELFAKAATFGFAGGVIIMMGVEAQLRDDDCK